MNYGLARNLSCHFLKVWGCDTYVKKLQPEKLEPKSEKCVFIGYPKETIGYTFYLRSEGKIFVAKNGSFLEKEFLSKGVSGRKVELDEVLPLEPESSAAQENVPVVPTPTGEEINDDDQGLRIKLLLNFVGPQGHVPHQSGTATLSWKSCC